MVILAQVRTKLPNLKTIIASSILLYIFHAIEKYFSGFPTTPYFLWLVGLFQGLTLPQSFFIVHDTFFIASISALFAVIFVKRAATVFLCLLGVALVLESSHLIITLYLMSYYPGLYTSLAFPILGVVYWIRLVSDLRNHDQIGEIRLADASERAD